MDNFEREFGDFAADYDVDVYDSADLKNGNFKFDAVIIKDYFSELKLRLLLNKIAMAATQIWKDCIVTLKSVKINSQSDDEYDFTFIVNFVDNSAKAEEGIKDTCAKDGVDGIDYKTDEVIITSDYSGDILEEGDCYIKDKTGEFGSTDEIFEDLKIMYHFRPVKKEALPQEFKELFFYDENDQYYTDDKHIKDSDIDNRYYTEEYINDEKQEFIEYFGYTLIDDFRDYRDLAEEIQEGKDEDALITWSGTND